MSADRGRQERQIALPADVHWRRVHPITPLLEGWKAITAVAAFLVWQNAQALTQVYSALRRVGRETASQVLLWAVVATAAVLVVFTVSMWLSWRMRSYAVDRDAVYLRTGVLNRQLRTARLPRIQSVDVVHPLLGRIFGLGRLTVEVAGGGDSRVSIGFLRTRDLESLREQVLTLAAGASTEPVPAPTSAQPAAGAAGAPPGPGAGPASTPLDAAHVLAQTGSGAAPAPAPAAPLPLGFEDAAQAAPLRARGKQAEEHYLYEVSPKTLLGAQLLTGVSLTIILMLIGLVAGMVALLVLKPLKEAPEVASALLSGLVPLLALPVALVSLGWSRFDKGWRFRATATPAGIRTRYGLTSETSSTLPPGRVHGVELSQGPLWRVPDWWHVKTSVAGRNQASQGSAGNNATTGTVLLPVGSRDLALRSLWLVVPHLGVADPAAFTRAALSGRDNEGVGQPTNASTPGRGFIRISPRGRVFSPLAWRREAIALTDTCVVLRLGRWWRRTSVIPYERVQSLKVTQGPLARLLGLAKIRFDMVDDQVNRVLANLDLADAAQIEQVVADRALWRRRHERLDRWLARATTPPPQPQGQPQAPPQAQP